MIRTLTVTTKRRDQMIEITKLVQAAVRETGMRDGTVVVYSTHTTAGIAINENADPDVVHDVLRRLDETFPWMHPDDRHLEGNTAAHLKAIATGTSQTIFVEAGRLVLGTWQGVYFCEFDGPRERRVLVKCIPDR